MLARQRHIPEKGWIKQRTPPIGSSGEHLARSRTEDILTKSLKKTNLGQRGAGTALQID